MYMYVYMYSITSYVLSWLWDINSYIYIHIHYTSYVSPKRIHHYNNYWWYPMISHDKSIQLLTVTLVAVRRKVTLVAGTTCKFQALSAVTGKGKRDIPWFFYKLLNNNIPWFFSTYRWKLLEDVSKEFASASAVLKAGKHWTLGQGGALEVVKTMGKLWEK